MVDEHPAGTAVCCSIYKALLGPLHKVKSLLNCTLPPGFKYIYRFFFNRVKQELEGSCTPVKISLSNGSSDVLEELAVVLLFL